MTNTVTLFLCGDVMLGRGIDQIMQRPSDPRLYEQFVESALDYVALAEEASGEIPRHVGPSYVWGDALEELERCGAELRIVNLETSVTTNDEPWLKGINYRMHPEHVRCLSAARIDCCVLANNHVLDWQRAGLAETLRTLEDAHVAYVGAGANLADAEAPVVLPARDGGRVLVFAAATEDSGVPASWAADAERAGVHLLPDLSERTVARVAENVRQHARPGDRIVYSVHWGGNWGYDVTAEERAFAHRLIDEANVHLVHGHSSHHPRPMEVHRGRLILYGAGDFLNDYEGIGNHEEYRADLGLMYFPTLGADGVLRELRMTPTRIRRFRIERASAGEGEWLRQTLDRICAPYGVGVERRDDGGFALRFR